MRIYKVMEVTFLEVKSWAGTMSVRTPTSARDGIGPVACRSCDLHEICRLSGLVAFDGGHIRQSTGGLRTVRPGEPLFRAGEPAHSLFAVRQGLLKTVHVNADGDEQILSLNTPGEVLGLEAFSTGTYANDAIALQAVVCCELPLRQLDEQGTRFREFGAALVRVLSKSVAPRLPPARGSVRQRLTTFLLDLGARLDKRGLDGRQFSLGLSRQEIGDLLDTRIETISRMIQQLNREEAIRVRGNKVSLLGLAPESKSPTRSKALTRTPDVTRRS
jgi:CRP/FNR family transcriptional regulator, anaerobic regulatory protein